MRLDWMARRARLPREDGSSLLSGLRGWVYMSYLRTKLEAAGEPRVLHTVRGLGYVLRDPP
jgi:hypothetical protein